MGFFARLATLLKSNLTDLLNRAEDPEKMLEQILIEMGEQLVEAKRQVAVAIADEKKLEKRVAAEQQEATQWEQKAMLAVRSGDDALAKEALARKKEHDATATQFREQWEKQKAAVEQLKAALRALNEKIEEAKRQKNLLVARARRAEAMKNIQETMSGITNDGAFSTFERMAQKIEQQEAEAEATAELAESHTGDVLKSKFKKLEQTAGADQELLALKQKMGLGAPPAEARVEAQVPAGEDAELAELESALEELKKRELGKG